MYLSDIDTKFDRLERNWVKEAGNNIKKIFVFDNHFCPIGKMAPITLENNLRNKTEWYILQNCSEIQQSIE